MIWCLYLEAKFFEWTLSFSSQTWTETGFFGTWKKSRKNRIMLARHASENRLWPTALLFQFIPLLCIVLISSILTILTPRAKTFNTLFDRVSDGESDGVQLGAVQIVLEWEKREKSEHTFQYFWIRQPAHALCCGLLFLSSRSPPTPRLPSEPHYKKLSLWKKK